MFLTMTLTTEMSDGGRPWSEAWAGTPGPSPAEAAAVSRDSLPTPGSGFPGPPGPSFSSGPEWMASFASMSGMSKAARRSSKSGVFMSPISAGPRLVPLLVRAETRRSLPHSSRCRHRRPPRGRRYFLLLSGSASPLPLLPPRSGSGLPAFALAIGPCPLRSALRPSQPRTGLVLSTAARN